MAQWYLDTGTDRCIYVKGHRLRADGTDGVLVDCVVDAKAVACPKKTGRTFILVSLHAHRIAKYRIMK